MKKMIITAVFAFAVFAAKAQTPAVSTTPDVAGEVKVEVAPAVDVAEIPVPAVEIATDAPTAPAVEVTNPKPCCKAKPANGTAAGAKCEKKCSKGAGSSAAATPATPADASKKKACSGSAGKPCCQGKAKS